MRMCRSRGTLLGGKFGILVLGAGELADHDGADLPVAALDGGLLFARADFGVVLGAAQLALNVDVIALLQVLGVVAGLAEADDAVPFRARYPFILLLVLVAGLGGER